MSSVRKGSIIYILDITGEWLYEVLDTDVQPYLPGSTPPRHFAPLGNYPLEDYPLEDYVFVRCFWGTITSEIGKRFFLNVKDFAWTIKGRVVKY